MADIVAAEEFVVGFGEFEPPKSWYHVFTQPGWRHTFCVGRGQDRWVLYDPLSRRADLAVLTDDQMEAMILACRRKGARFLLFRSHRRHLFQRLVPVYCVSCVRHVLGVQKFVWTPSQLYRLLLDLGAVPVFEEIGNA